MFAFRGTNSTSQAFSGGTTTELTLGSETFDTATAFASNRFTVTAGLDGTYGCLWAGIRCLASEAGLSIYIQRSTNGGSSWETIARRGGSDNVFARTTCTGPILLTEGHIYRAAMAASTAGSLNNTPRVFFGGRGVGAVAAFRATTSGTQAISATTETEVNFGTEVFDAYSAFASNRFTVPAGLNGLYGDFTAGLLFQAAEGHSVYIQRSTDGGSNWDYLAQDDSNDTDRNCATGPHLLTTGHIYRVAAFIDTAATVENSPRTFFAGQAFEAA